VDLYRHAGELGWPVFIHMDVWHRGCSFWYNHDIDAFERVIRAMPGVTFIGHGPGWWREISGSAAEDPPGYPKGPVAPGGKLPRLLAEYPNVYADLSAGSGLNALTRDAEAGRRFVDDHSRKLLYGTDCYDTKHIDHLRSLELPGEVLRAITHGNAASIIPV
jgi:predicted TIM-barrel fold metal-dependent hydrolase